MEKEGALQQLTDKGLAVQVLVTDRHKQIAKWMRVTHLEIKHYFEVWHIAKGMEIDSFINQIHVTACIPAGLHGE